MHILIIILIVIGSIIALLLLIALLTKRDFSVERTITINRAKTDVFNYAQMLKNQEKYNVWMMRDPNVQIVYTGTDGTVGAVSAWKSNHKHVGVGEQEIKKLLEGESIEAEMRFKVPFDDTNYTSTIVKDAGNGQTIITHRVYGRNEFPRNLMNLMMNKMLGKDIQQNLENMKNNLEK
jgi:Polyketide cyclase / dehydrase and lipid transport